MQDLLFVRQALRRMHPELEVEHLLLVGHGNDGDIAMLFSSEGGQGRGVPHEVAPSRVRARRAVLRAPAAALLGPSAPALTLPRSSSKTTTRLGSRFGVGEKPDFVVTSITARSSVKPGSFFNASVLLCNQGTSVGSTSVSLYLSEDTVVTPASPYVPTSDSLGGTESGSTLAPGQCETLMVSAYAGASLYGSLHVGAFADPDATTPSSSRTTTPGRVASSTSIQP